MIASPPGAAPSLNGMRVPLGGPALAPPGAHMHMVTPVSAPNQIASGQPGPQLGQQFAHILSGASPLQSNRQIGPGVVYPTPSMPATSRVEDLHTMRGQPLFATNKQQPAVQGMLPRPPSPARLQVQAFAVAKDTETRTALSARTQSPQRPFALYSTVQLPVKTGVDDTTKGKVVRPLGSQPFATQPIMQSPYQNGRATPQLITSDRMVVPNSVNDSRALSPPRSQLLAVSPQQFQQPVRQKPAPSFQACPEQLSSPPRSDTDSNRFHKAQPPAWAKDDLVAPAVISFPAAGFLLTMLL